MNKKVTGVVHGRFQPFHIGHLDYVMRAKEKCDFLYIGISNPDPSLIKENKFNTNRSKYSANPFSYYHRLKMIDETLLDYKFIPNEFTVVPFPINFPQYIKYYVPLHSIYFITIYDDWGFYKKDILENLGLKVIVLEQGQKNLKLASGTHIRQLLKSGKDWKRYVPKAVEKIIIEENLKSLI